MSGESDSRKRLRPWLEAKINGGTIPGLYWVNEEKTMFRIPWKHAGKQDWTPDQSLLFMEWAKHTGRYREGVDERDYATWKTRLRCAFNKAPDIQEVKEMTNLDAVQPFRVYKLLPKKTTKRLPGLETIPSENVTVKQELLDMESYVQQNNLNPKLPQVVERLTRGEQAMSISGSMPSDLKSINSQDILRPEDGTAQLEKIKQEIAEGEQSMDCADGIGSGMTEKSSYSAASTVVEASQMDNTPQFIDLTSLQDSLPPETPIMYRHTTAQGGVSGGTATVSESTQWFAQQSPQAIHQPQPSPHQQPMTELQHQVVAYPQVQMSPQTVVTASPTSTTYTDLLQPQQQQVEILQERIQEVQEGIAPVGPPQQFQGHEMHITLKYTDKHVSEQWVNVPAGCRIYHGTDSDIRSVAAQNVSQQLLGPPNMEQLEMPPTTGLFQSANIEGYAKQLLENMERGLLLQCRNGNIYANRLCKCKVFYSRDSSGNNCYDIPRETATRIFDYDNHFKPAMDAYRNGRSSEFPSAQVNLWFGQRIQPGHSASKVLISASIVSGRAASQLDMGEAENSLPSMLISKSDDGDRLAGTLKQMVQ